jgi:DNA primase large subunit
MDKAISSITSSTIDESELNSEFKLNLKNIDAVSKKFFPPCAAHLNQKLKENGHLKHDGRRQLWLFLKQCGMRLEDNKEYIRRHMQLKVSNSDLKSHMYNIEHAYGLVGKKEQERSKNCRGIITGPEPKSGEHHGCPFKHWGNDKMEDYIINNYQSINRDAVKDIIGLKKDNYFQVCISNYLYRLLVEDCSRRLISHKA